MTREKRKVTLVYGLHKQEVTLEQLKYCTKLVLFEAAKGYELSDKIGFSHVDRITTKDFDDLVRQYKGLGFVELPPKGAY